MDKMIPFYNTENIPGQKYALKSIVGGELRGYSEMLNEARAIATKRMMQEAEGLNADAVVNIRYTTSTVMQGAAEILVYGTAVKFV